MFELAVTKQLIEVLLESLLSRSLVTALTRRVRVLETVGFQSRGSQILRSPIVENRLRELGHPSALCETDVFAAPGLRIYRPRHQRERCRQAFQCLLRRLGRGPAPRRRDRPGWLGHTNHHTAEMSVIASDGVRY